jgi:hypothetical protein
VIQRAITPSRCAERGPDRPGTSAPAAALLQLQRPSSGTDCHSAATRRR